MRLALWCFVGARGRGPGTSARPRRRAIDCDEFWFKELLVISHR